MLNKFKNVIYGTSNPSDDETPADSLVQCRKPTFREQLYREVYRANWNKNNDNNNSLVGVYQEDTRSPNKGRVSNNGNSNDDKRIPFLSRDTFKQQDNSRTKSPKFRYSRPEFLQLKTDDEISVSADHQIRPIILPRDLTKLPWNSGYAECINAGKSARNEDQAVCYRGVATRKPNLIPTDQSESNIDELPWIYFGIFDGHAGNAVAVAAAKQLHKMIAEKLQGIVDILLALEFESERDDDDESEEYLDHKESRTEGGKCSGRKYLDTPDVDCHKKPMNQSKNINETIEKQAEPKDTNDNQVSSDVTNVDDQEDKPTAHAKETREANHNSVKHSIETRQSNGLGTPKRKLKNMTEKGRNISIAQRFCISADDLIIGVLETSFCEMDAQIAQDKQNYEMRGGCTAIVSLFILGKLYVCNAGDSRAIVCKKGLILPMSFDFTPTSERERILRLGQQRPEFMGTDFTHLEFLRRPTRQDLGKQMLYKDAYMTGWSMKTITYDDLKFPLVSGDGKRSRVLATIGVTRGFGDHELRAQYGSVPIKPFLTPEPEVRVLDLENDESLSEQDVLIMGSDGLWDVTSNQDATMTVLVSSCLLQESEESRSKYQYMTSAQDLVIRSRGTTEWDNVWRTSDNRMASLDDITVFVIPLKQYREEYLEWKKSRFEAVAAAESRNNKTNALSADESTLNGECHLSTVASD